jgi:hypothetical protein
MPLPEALVHTFPSAFPNASAVWLERSYFAFGLVVLLE